MTFRTCALGAVFSCLSATIALASDPLPPGDDGFIVYSEVGDWTVYVDKAREACLIERADADGNAVQMGLSKNHKHAYVGVFTLADIDVHTRQKVEIMVDGAVFEGRAHGVKSHKLVGDYKGGYVLVKDENMVTAIQQGYEMIVFPKKDFAFVVDLTGTKDAIDEARKCNLDQVKA